MYICCSVFTHCVLWCISDPWLNELKAELTSTQRRAYAPGTLKNLRSQWNKFAKFIELSHCKLPLDCENLCLYIQYLSRSLASPQSIRNYVSGIKTLHLLLELPFPNIKDLSVRLTLQGIDKSLAHIPQPAEPMTTELLLKIHKTLDFSVMKLTWSFGRCF